MAGAGAPSVLDLSGVAVITGGASGFGLTVADRLVQNGMAVAILDVSAKELEAAERRLATASAGQKKCLAVLCDVTKFEQCQAAQAAVAAAFPGLRVSFLFNNAGILGKDADGVLKGSASSWAPVFAVNLFGAMHILKAFLPSMLEAGPLPSGKKSYIVTTSSVVGLLNHNPGPYSVSKMAVTSMCEQLSIELQELGAEAAHISSHTLHPTVAASNFLTQRDADSSQAVDPAIVEMVTNMGMTKPSEVADALFRGLEESKYYIVLDHPTDVPTSEQLAMRFEDQSSGRQPRRPEQLGMLMMMSGRAKEVKARQKKRQRTPVAAAAAASHSKL